MILDNILSGFQKKQGDSHSKSIFKAFTWRLLGTLDTMLISYFVTGRIWAALSIGSLEVFTKIVLYYLHERAWNVSIQSKKKYAK